MPDPKKKNNHPFLNRLRVWLTTNIGIKLLSVALAILLWVVVVYNDESITRSRTLNGLSALLNGQNSLASNSLALIENPLDALNGNITVELDVPQAHYSLVSESNVRVWLDLSNIRTAGTQLVPLNVTCTYGSVKNVFPSTVEVQVEALDSRSVPLNAVLTGKHRNYWYNVQALNPSTITVSGASSIVQNLSQGQLEVDVSNMTETTTRAYPFQLYDYSGDEVPQDLLTRSSSSVTAAIEVFPTKELPVSNDIEDILQGRVADGYTVKSITITPSTVTVAAEESLLDSLSELAIEPVEVDSVDRSFTVRRPISKLSDIRYFSTEQVYVTVEIEESVDSVVFSDVPVVLLNTPDHLEVTDTPDAINVRVTGGLSEISALTADMLQATVDLSQASGGVNSYPVEISVPGHPNLTFEVTPSTLPVSLAEREISTNGTNDGGTNP
ncbi:MAG: CdaR family protein [Clostridia bacterium]|nr:CdaR family protein [Clostridia bacterium]